MPIHVHYVEKAMNRAINRAAILVDLDQVYATHHLSDRALTAAGWTEDEFDPSFPGWALYRRIVAGTDLFDRALDAWAVALARQLSRAQRRDGRSYIGQATRGKRGWVAQAGRDGLSLAVEGRAPAVSLRATRFGVHEGTYRKLRDPIAAGMQAGFEHFRAELHANYFRVRKTEMLDSGETIGVRGASFGPQSGNWWVNPGSRSVDDAPED